MGYSSISWFFVAFLASPLVALYLLAALPDRSVEEKRKKDLELLEIQLAKSETYSKDTDTNVLPRFTISDDPTIR